MTIVRQWQSRLELEAHLRAAHFFVTSEIREPDVEHFARMHEEDHGLRAHNHEHQTEDPA